MWVNGAFGSGKTTLVEELRGRWPEALVFDPEVIGYVLREIVEVPTGDFQDLRLWRRQVAESLVGPGGGVPAAGAGADDPGERRVRG